MTTSHDMTGDYRSRYTLPMRYLLILSILATSAFAQTLDERVRRELPSLIETYQILHAAPELSLQEKNTSAYLASRLRQLGYQVTERFGAYDEPGLTCYGVVAVMRNGSGPVVLVRTDMDALPVTEQTGLAYASKNEGVMHACGHDVHMSTLIGTAKILADLRSQWSGTVVLIGQPAEELGRGAAAMLRAGLYERFPRPDFAIALHDWALLPAGKVSYRPGFIMAASNAVDITVRGMGGHGATPEKTRDPIVVAAQIVLALQTIVSRETSALDPVVLTIGSIHGGTKRNIIPDDVKLLLTVRTYKPEVQRRVLAAIERTARGVALAAGFPPELAPLVEIHPGESTPATYNDPALAERLAGAVRREIGASEVVEGDQVMVSEDFGRFSLEQKIPAAMLFLGAADPRKVAAGEEVPALHSSQFAPPAELTLRTGVRAMTAMALELLKK
ncbi:MAG TPA: amidohydrolase [Thermoanaerobaculia bacterium]|nr:amidohydrolase [Thermoanaerobaculia bacterium]